MMEDKKTLQTPSPLVLKPRLGKTPEPVAASPENPKKKDKTAEFRRGMASLVGCGNVQDFGAKLRAKIEAYREKLRQKKAVRADTQTPDTQGVRTRLEAQRRAYHDTKNINPPVLPSQEKSQNHQAKQNNRQFPKWCYQRCDRAG